MRSSGSTEVDLDEAISNFAREIAGSIISDRDPEIHVRIEGTFTPVNPVVRGEIRDEIYRIATEGIRNAVLHSHADRIDVEIRYDEHGLRLRIGDNGTGIDPVVFAHEHKAGHWGLLGMRERANLVGGTLEVWSQVNTGTEIYLIVPAASVFAKSSPRRQSLLSRIWRR